MPTAPLIPLPNRSFRQTAALDISLNWLYFDLEEADAKGGK